MTILAALPGLLAGIGLLAAGTMDPNARIAHNGRQAHPAAIGAALVAYEVACCLLA